MSDYTCRQPQGQNADEPRDEIWHRDSDQAVNVGNILIWDRPASIQAADDRPADPAPPERAHRQMPP